MSDDSYNCRVTVVIRHLCSAIGNTLFDPSKVMKCSCQPLMTSISSGGEAELAFLHRCRRWGTAVEVDVAVNRAAATELMMEMSNECGHYQADRSSYLWILCTWPPPRRGVNTRVNSLLLTVNNLFNNNEVQLWLASSTSTVLRRRWKGGQCSAGSRDLLNAPFDQNNGAARRKNVSQLSQRRPLE